MKRWLLFIPPLVVIALLVVAVMGGNPPSFLEQFFSSSQTPQGGSGRIEYWGLFESRELIQPLIEEYETAHPGVTIVYSQRSFPTLTQYKETLFTRLVQEEGPDILRIHSTWVPQFASELTPVPRSVLTEAEYEETFFPVALDSAKVGGELYSVPLQYEGLALFMNEEALAEIEGGRIPQTWDEFRLQAVKLTKEEGGRIIRGGAAIGTANNVDHSSDIFGLMLAQSGLKFPEDLDSQPAQDALSFFTGFVTRDRVWDPNLPSSVQSFAREQAAMILAPSWQVFTIKALNPELRFTLHPVPQIPALEGQEQTNIHWGNFWVEAVSADSPSQALAWDFLKFLSSKESQQKIYDLATRNRLFGTPYSRKDLAEDITLDPFVYPVLSGAPTAQTNLLAGGAGNDLYTDAFEAAVESVVKGDANVEEALGGLKDTVTKLMSSGR